MQYSTSKNSKTPLILKRVASLTTVRDFDIFEFSLLKTLAEMLDVDEVSIYKIDNFKEPCRLIRYTSSIQVNDQKKKIDESQEIQIENVPTPKVLKNALEWIESTQDIYSSKVDGKFLTVLPVKGINGTTGYLSVSLENELSDSQNLVLTSLLTIADNFHSLLDDNRKDKLTGLLNRKTFDDSIFKIQEIMAFSARDNIDSFSGPNRRSDSSDQEQYWLSIIDIDSFKKINDEFGHIYGDEVLLMLSQIMKKTFRPRDLLFRFGGEEFIVVAKTQSQKEAKIIFERFRKAIADFMFPQIGQVTISLGATLISAEHAIASEIVGRADQALYYSKKNGKNQLSFYEDLIASGVIKEKNDLGDVELF